QSVADDGPDCTVGRSTEVQCLVVFSECVVKSSEFNAGCVAEVTQRCDRSGLVSGQDAIEVEEDCPDPAFARSCCVSTVHATSGARRGLPRFAWRARMPCPRGQSANMSRRKCRQRSPEEERHQGAVPECRSDADGAVDARSTYPLPGF